MYELFLISDLMTELGLIILLSFSFTYFEERFIKLGTTNNSSDGFDGLIVMI
jgi:hypothetical protein